jgi:hypothetical protein
MPTLRMAGWVYAKPPSLWKEICTSRPRLANNPLLVRTARLPFTTFNFQYSASMSPKEGYFSPLRENIVYQLSSNFMKLVCKKGFGWFQRFETAREFHYYFTKFVPNISSLFNQFCVNKNGFNLYFLDYRNPLNLQSTRTLRGAARARQGLKRALHYERMFRRPDKQIQMSFLRFFKIRYLRYVSNIDRMNMFNDYSFWGNTIHYVSGAFKQLIKQYEK